MRGYYCIGCALILIAMALGNGGSAAEEKSSSIESSLRIQSARVTRSSADFNKRFPARYYTYNDGNPGVSLQFLFSISEGIILPISNDSITIETFVDDTFQNLQASGVDTSYSGNRQGTVSEDGKTVLFTIATSRTPAEDAGRVFVRGAINARISRVGPIVATNQVSLIVGEEAMIGPFHTAIQAAQSLPSGLNLSITITGDAARVQKIRILDQKLNVMGEGRLSSFEVGDRPANASLNVRGTPKDALTLEITYLEKADRMRIPFEAQVDIGVAKAGPIEVGTVTTPNRTGTQTWPPPRENAQNLPARRPAFNPDENKVATNANPRIVESAAVDIFSLSVGKSDPSDSPSTIWKNPPPPSFHAAAFTTARLMLSVPEVSILSVAPDGVSITRFEDDKGAKLDTTLYRETLSASYSSFPPTRYSPDGQQMLLTLALVGSPSPGATRCILGGEIRARVGRGESTNFADKVDLRRGDTFTVGPFTGKVTTLRETPPLQPPFTGLNFELWLSISGPVNKLRSIEILDRDGKPFNSTPVAPGDFPSAQSGELRCAFHLPTPIKGAVRFKFCYYLSDEIVRVPFELNTGIGL